MFMLHNSGRDTTAAAMRGVGSRRIVQESSERRNGDQVAIARDIAHGVVLSTISFSTGEAPHAKLLYIILRLQTTARRRLHAPRRLPFMRALC